MEGEMRSGFSTTVSFFFAFALHKHQNAFSNLMHLAFLACMQGSRIGFSCLFFSLVKRISLFSALTLDSSQAAGVYF